MNSHEKDFSAPPPTPPNHPINTPITSILSSIGNENKEIVQMALADLPHLACGLFMIWQERKRRSVSDMENKHVYPVEDVISTSPFHSLCLSCAHPHPHQWTPRYVQTRQRGRTANLISLTVMLFLASFFILTGGLFHVHS